MKRYIKNNYKEIFIYSLLYISLIVGFWYDENLTVGAFWDYNETKGIAEDFIIDFKDTFLNYDKHHSRHSPVFVIIISKLTEIFENDTIVSKQRNFM